MQVLRRLWEEQDGGTAVEYSLIVGLISLAILVTAGLLGEALDTKFSEAASRVDAAGT